AGQGHLPEKMRIRRNHGRAYLNSIARNSRKKPGVSVVAVPNEEISRNEFRHRLGSAVFLNVLAGGKQAHAHLGNAVLLPALILGRVVSKVEGKGGTGVWIESSRRVADVPLYG